ncbi:MAG: ABC transporter ATP-binding protein [Crenarchaeota archaeon]|nr:ABC transporter ATP-binding protein [Thermoproteota archaeon]
MNGIEVVNLRKRYVAREGFRKKRIVEALKGISFVVPKGSIHALLGPNGAGKTTTVRILATLLLPDGGEARIMGLDVVREAPRVREIIGVVLDVSKGFYMSLSGYENLVFYALLKGFSLSEARRRAREVLELVGLEQMGASKRPYYTYSLGMRARLAIAKALISDPQVMILDEPTLGLDVESSRMVRELLVDLAKEGRTILVTGHNMHEIEAISNAVTIIDRGRVVASGEPRELKERLGLLYRLKLKLAGPNAKDFIERLKGSLDVSKVETSESSSFIEVSMLVRDRREVIAQTVFELAKSVDVKVLDFSLTEPSLEDAYIAIVGGHREEAG